MLEDDTSPDGYRVNESGAYVVINNNIPYFSDSDLSTTSFETYSNLDSLRRCGVAYACIGIDLMPTGNRDYNGQIHPTGWQQAQYSGIDGGYLYNRCHLIGYQLTAESSKGLRSVISPLTGYLFTKSNRPIIRQIV